MKAPGEKQFRNDSPSAPRDRLVTELAKAESDLERIEAQRTAANARIAALRNELAALDASPQPMAPEPQSELAPRTPADKVKLFRQLFRGRPDLYPTRFVSKKTGKAGYAPACSNKFVPGVCELPKVKCGDCTRQAFKPVDDAAVTCAPEGPACDGRLSDARRRDLLVPRRRLRQEHVDGGRTRVRADRAVDWGCPWRSSVHARATERTSGSSSRPPSRQRPRARWVATSSPRRWPADTSLAWTPTTGSFRARTRCRAVASAT